MLLLCVLILQYIFLGDEFHPNTSICRHGDRARGIYQCAIIQEYMSKLGQCSNGKSGRQDSASHNSRKGNKVCLANNTLTLSFHPFPSYPTRLSPFSSSCFPILLMLSILPLPPFPCYST